MALLKMDSKEFLRVFGIFIGIITVFFLIDFGFVRLAEKNMTAALQHAVDEILEEKMPGRWTITGTAAILSPFSTSASLYELRDKKSAEQAYAIIIRTTTLFGPYPAVFLYKKNAASEFIGYACVKGRVKRILEENPSVPLIKYWAKKTEKIIAGSVQQGV